MGSELIKKISDMFERRQRRSLDLLDEPTLFTGTPQLSIAVTVTPHNGHRFALGDEYRLTIHEESLVVVRGVSIVGLVENPPSSVIGVMQDASPSAFGHIINVFEMTDKAELLLE